MVCDVQKENRAYAADERHFRIPLCAQELEGYADASQHAAPTAGICYDSIGSGSPTDTELVGQQDR